jgi:hypothetical protein
MAKDRLSLQTFLEELLGSRNVYFQPPPSIKMNYPAIKYQLSNIQNTNADNIPYMQGTGYQITVIDEDPDSVISKTISKLPMCRFDRFYTADNLNHFVYTIFY